LFDILVFLFNLVGGNKMDWNILGRDLWMWFWWWVMG